MGVVHERFWLLVLGVIALFAFIVSGVFLIAAPELLGSEEEE